jgi:hypothetical protein
LERSSLCQTCSQILFPRLHDSWNRERYQELDLPYETKCSRNRKSLLRLAKHQQQPTPPKSLV